MTVQVTKRLVVIVVASLRYVLPNPAVRVSGKKNHAFNKSDEILKPTGDLGVQSE